LASIDKIRDKVVKKYADNQQGLFSQDDVNKSLNSSSSISFLLEDLPEFADEEIETLERQLLGFSLSAKPINEILGPYEDKASHKISELADEMLSQEMVTIAALVKEVRVIITRKSAQEMAFVKVEDTSGNLDVIVFPKIFASTRDLWVENKPLVISGKIDIRDESVNLIAESLGALSSPSSKPDRLFIKIPKNVSSEQLVKLKKLLLANPGNNLTTLFFEESKRKIDLPYKVSWTPDLAKKIDSLLHDFLPS
jgi:DNA polymerase-3 subunit alpha